MPNLGTLAAERMALELIRCTNHHVEESDRECLRMERTDTDNQQENETRATRVALVEALDGKRELTWAIWSSPLYESAFLTDEGRRAAAWAVDVLQAFLGDDFLQRVRMARVQHALLSGALLSSLWPMIDSRRVYEDLFRLAAQISRCMPQSKRLRDVQKTMRQNFDETSWTHCLIQLELAALAQQQGWACEFEAKLSTGKRGDVRLDKDGFAIAVEVTSVGASVPEQEAESFFHYVFMRLLAIEMQYGVHVHGAVGDVVPPEERDRWIKDIEEAAQSTGQDRLERYVPGPAEAAVWVIPEAFRPNETHLEGPAGTTDIWGRLNARINLKGRKTAGSGTTWIRLQEHAGLWLSMLLSHMSFAERVVAITPYLRSMLDPFPHVLGIIISPGLMWQDDEPSEQTITLPDLPGVVALRRPVAQARVRETVIVSRSDHTDPGADVLMNLYREEGAWLEWALEQLGHLRLDALFQ